MGRSSHRAGRVDGLGLDAALIAFPGELAPERPANRRHGVVVVQGDDGVQGELAVVHALGDDHFVVAVGGLRADPGDSLMVASNPFAALDCRPMTLPLPNGNDIANQRQRRHHLAT